MATKRDCDASLGRLGIVNRETLGIHECDVGRGWQTLWTGTATTSTITDLNNKPTASLRLPPEGRNVEIRILGATSAGTVAGDIFGFPLDPTHDTAGTNAEINDTDGGAAGEFLETYTFTMSSRTADSPSRSSVTSSYVSDAVIVDRRGYQWFAIKPTAATTIVPASGLEAVARTF